MSLTPHKACEERDYRVASAHLPLRSRIEGPSERTMGEDWKLYRVQPRSLISFSYPSRDHALRRAVLLFALVASRASSLIVSGAC
jgi:hypothetical protein